MRKMNSDEEYAKKYNQYQISAGIHAPVECECAAGLFFHYLVMNHPIYDPIKVDGENSGDLKSVIFETPDDLDKYIGTIQWICKSPYRKNHKRKNWFISFQRVGINEVDKEEFDESMFSYEPLHSGGPGGQNVNKVETGIRCIYKPTGEFVVCTEERSQHANLIKAKEQMISLIKKRNEEKLAKATNDAWSQHNSIQRGDPVVTFVGTEFKLREKKA